MRIDDLNRTPLAPGAERADQAAGKQALDKNGKPAAADQAEVSEVAQALASGDSGRLQRLERLRLEVQSGKYNVSADVVAKAIIEAHSSD